MQSWLEFLNQYPQTNNERGMTYLSHLGLLKISGSDAKKFLQGQLTCNLDEITATQSRLGAHCNPKGRIISLFRIFYFDECYYLQMPRSMISVAITAFKKYAVFFKVTLEDASDELISVGIMYEGLNPFPKDIDEAQMINDVVIIRVSGEKHRYIMTGRLAAITSFWTNLSSTIPHISVDAWRYQDILTETVNIYPETSELFLPHELNLHLKNGVSFNKGCYTGQEIIARMHYRGRSKSQLRHIIINDGILIERGKDIPETHDCVVDFCENNNQLDLLIISSEAT